jgi:hypothetical protein
MVPCGAVAQVHTAQAVLLLLDTALVLPCLAASRAQLASACTQCILVLFRGTFAGYAFAPYRLEGA